MTPLVGSCQHSPAREVHSSELPETGKEAVNIERIEPQGGYAIRILFGERGDPAAIVP